MRRSFIIAAFSCVGALMVLMVWPVYYLAAPDWNVTVVDDHGQPIAGALVRESYQNYSISSSGNEVDARSDADGKAFFQAKEMRTSRLEKALGTASSAMALAHASFGIHDNVYAFVDEASGMSNEWTGSPRKMQSLIVVKSQSSK